VAAHCVHIPNPAIGDIVSFSYDNFSRGDLPANPVIYRVRSDLLWDDIMDDGRDGNSNK
jgi:hypothetical protein